MTDQPGSGTETTDQVPTADESASSGAASTSPPVDTASNDTSNGASTSAATEPAADPGADSAADSATDRATDAAAGDEEDADRGGHDEKGEKGKKREQEREKSAEEFASEHDPAEHDVAASEEMRQRGDWTADEAGGPQVWDAEGNLVEGTSPAEHSTGEVSSEHGDGQGTERRTSSFEEIRDGGYSVGSAAPIDDGAMPLGHPVRAWEGTKTFATPDHPGQADAEPDVWFTDAEAAGRAGFHPAD